MVLVHNFAMCPQIGFKNLRVGWKILIRFLPNSSAVPKNLMVDHHRLC